MAGEARLHRRRVRGDHQLRFGFGLLIVPTVAILALSPKLKPSHGTPEVKIDVLGLSPLLLLIVGGILIMACFLL